jgi:glycosyltransferase involved in cell wall biosynthesis
MGHYLPDTLKSVDEYIDNTKHEVIIIDDGSTDEKTILLLNEIEKLNKYNIIRQANKGLGGARNTGIKASKGKYILPLDADNLLTPFYITKGVDYLEKNNDIAVVYAKSKCFDEGSGYLRSIPFSLQTIFQFNYIDACALIRKEALLAVGMYDDNKRTGIEDWDLWIRMGLGFYKFYYFENEIGQQYRVVSTSMIHSQSKIKKDENVDYLASKYPGLMDLKRLDDFMFLKFTRAPFAWTLKLFIKKYLPRYYLYLIKKGKIRKYL